MATKKVVHKVNVQTVNRGSCTYIISVDSRGYWAHELGELTQWAKVMGTDEQKAHRINPSARRGNQYGTYWRLRPFKTPSEVVRAIRAYSQTHLIHV